MVKKEKEAIGAEGGNAAKPHRALVEQRMRQQRHENHAVTAKQVFHMRPRHAQAVPKTFEIAKSFFDGKRLPQRFFTTEPVRAARLDA